MSTIGTSKGKSWAAAIWLVVALLYSTPALTQVAGNKSPAAAIEAAAEARDTAGAAYGKMAKYADEYNGQPEILPPLRVERYRQAADADEKAAKQFEQAGKNWKEAADKYKDAVTDIKRPKEKESLQLIKKMEDRQKKAKRSNQYAIRAYNAAAIERDKAAVGISDADQVVERDKAATNREAAAHVGKESKDDKASKGGNKDSKDE